jgi:hypothetical protein
MTDIRALNRQAAERRMERQRSICHVEPDVIVASGRDKQKRRRQSFRSDAPPDKLDMPSIGQVLKEQAQQQKEQRPPRRGSRAHARASIPEKSARRHKPPIPAVVQVSTSSTSSSSSFSPSPLPPPPPPPPRRTMTQGETQPVNTNYNSSKDTSEKTAKIKPDSRRQSLVIRDLVTSRKKLEMENLRLRAELMEAKKMIHQLREQQIIQAQNANNKKPEKKSKGFFWMRKKNKPKTITVKNISNSNSNNSPKGIYPAIVGPMNYAAAGPGATTATAASTQKQKNQTAARTTTATEGAALCQPRRNNRPLIQQVPSSIKIESLGGEQYDFLVNLAKTAEPAE